MDLMVDTGASLTVLSTGLAKRLGLTPHRSEIRMTTGTHTGLACEVAKLDRIGLGGAWVKSELAVVMDLPPVEGFEGVLGMSTLADWASK